jgi:hypothetical protein
MSQVRQSIKAAKGFKVYHSIYSLAHNCTFAEFATPSQVIQRSRLSVQPLPALNNPYRNFDFGNHSFSGLALVIFNLSGSLVSVSFCKIVGKKRGVCGGRKKIKQDWWAMVSMFTVSVDMTHI